MAKNSCECGDPGCPACGGNCQKASVINLRRVDMEDETGTMFCQKCADDALGSGLFFVDVGAKIKYSRKPMMAYPKGRW
jgi:hypothetical protein